MQASPHVTGLVHNAMDDPGVYREMVADLPGDVPSLVALVQNALVHQHIAGWVYGLKFDAVRTKEPWLRTVEEKLGWLKSHGYRHVGDPHPVEERMVGICRDFSVLATCLFRQAGIPARARCGFSAYFEAGKFIDHWVVEWWNPDRSAWQLTDAQLDGPQLDKLGHPVDALDVPRDRFLTAPLAWQAARTGRADPMKFGILQWWGYDFLAWNLMLDANSMLGDPFQPWDRWGTYSSRPSEVWQPEDYETFDALAGAVELGSEALTDFFAKHPGLCIPSDWSQVVNGQAVWRRSQFLEQRGAEQ